MEQQSLSPVIKKLEQVFSKLNKRFYGGELQKPVISVSPDTTKGAYGWCTGWKAWKDNEGEEYYEINLCAEYLARLSLEVAETLLHEMAHLYNLQKGVSDTSQNGRYHNKAFKMAANAHGLKAEKTEKTGYSKTSLTQEAKEYVESLGELDFDLSRILTPRQTTKQSSRKYKCPGCGTIIRATKEVYVLCKECNKDFELEKNRSQKGKKK